jgi:hypothetical protein
LVHNSLHINLNIAEPPEIRLKKLCRTHVAATICCKTNQKVLLDPLILSDQNKYYAIVLTYYFLDISVYASGCFLGLISH